jgi:hypothetical protein
VAIQGEILQGFASADETSEKALLKNKEKSEGL